MFHSQRVSSKNYSTAFGGGYKVYGVCVIETIFFPHQRIVPWVLYLCVAFSIAVLMVKT
jgi:hypothetical protein